MFVVCVLIIGCGLACGVCCLLRIVCHLVFVVSISWFELLFSCVCCVLLVVWCLLFAGTGLLCVARCVVC